MMSWILSISFISFSCRLQEKNAEELAETIYQFVSSLPKPVRKVVEDPGHEHIKMFKGSHDGIDHHQHDHAKGVNEGHGHDHLAGYMDAYGLNDGWGNWYICIVHNVFMAECLWLSVFGCM